MDIVRVAIPLSRPYHVSSGAVSAFQNLLVRLHGEDGTIGLGEWAGSLGYVAADIGDAERILRDDFAPCIIGLDSMDVEAIVDKLEPDAQTYLEPVAAIDMALWDLNGKALSVPAYHLLGGKTRRRIPVDYTLSRDDPQTAAAKAREMAERFGYKAFSVKVGGEPELDRDIARVRSVREGLGPHARIRLDANGGLSAESAIDLLTEVERYDVELIEQPVPPHDLSALVQVSRAVPTRISIDEGLVSLRDAWDLADSGAVQVFNIKIPKNGGLLLSRKIAAIAEAAGLDCICGGALALEIVRQASRHFATAITLGDTDLAHEGPGPASQALEGDIATRVIGFEDVAHAQGHVAARDEPGLGVTEHTASVTKHTVTSVRVE